MAKGLVWYLIAVRGNDIWTYRVPRIADVQVIDRRFERPAGFRLADHWNLVCQRLIKTFPSYVVKLRTTQTGLHRLRWSGARILRSHHRAGKVDVTVDLEAIEEARAVILSLGSDTVVIQPAELAASIADTARSIWQNYDPDTMKTRHAQCTRAAVRAVLDRTRRSPEPSPTPSAAPVPKLANAMIAVPAKFLH